MLISKFKTALHAWKKWAQRCADDELIVTEVMQMQELYRSCFPSDNETNLPLAFEFFCAGYYSAKQKA